MDGTATGRVVTGIPRRAATISIPTSGGDAEVAAEVVVEGAAGAVAEAAVAAGADGVQSGAPDWRPGHSGLAQGTANGGLPHSESPFSFTLRGRSRSGRQSQRAA